MHLASTRWIGAGEFSKYLVSPKSGIQEIHQFQQRWASWFVGNTVCSNGSLYLSTPIDPLFLMIPALDKAREHGNYCDIEQCIVCLLGEQHSQRCGLLLGNVLDMKQGGQNIFENICDIKEACGQQYYKLSDEKTVSWLLKKIDMLKKGLCSGKGSNNSSATAFSGMDDISLTSYAANFLMSKYLAPKWREVLKRAMNFAEGDDGPMAETADMIREFPSSGKDPINENETKRAKVDPKVAAKAKAMESRAAAKAAKLAKDAAGMRKMSSFFNPQKD